MLNGPGDHHCLAMHLKIRASKLKETVHDATFYKFYNCTTTRPLSDQYLYLFASFTNLILRCCFL